MTVLDLCQFAGLRYLDDNGEEHYGGEGLTAEQNQRLDAAFAPFVGRPFTRHKAVELAQLALDGLGVPVGFDPSAPE